MITQPNIKALLWPNTKWFSYMASNPQPGEIWLTQVQHQGPDYICMLHSCLQNATETTSQKMLSCSSRRWMSISLFEEQLLLFVFKQHWAVLFWTQLIKSYDYDHKITLVPGADKTESCFFLYSLDLLLLWDTLMEKCPEAAIYTTWKQEFYPKPSPRWLSACMTFSLQSVHASALAMSWWNGRIKKVLLYLSKRFISSKL